MDACKGIKEYQRRVSGVEEHTKDLLSKLPKECKGEKRKCVLPLISVPKHHITPLFFFITPPFLCVWNFLFFIIFLIRHHRNKAGKRGEG